MESVEFNNMRRTMVDSQLRTSGVTSGWVLAAMADVPREDFVPEAHHRTAYMDRALPLAGGGTLNPAVATALMLQAADIARDERVLLLVSPTGYTASIVSKRTAHLVAVEALGNLPAAHRFSLIIVDGAVEELPDTLLQMAEENARIVTGIVERGVTRLAAGIVRGGRVALRPFADTEIAVLPGFARTQEFVF